MKRNIAPVSPIQRTTLTEAAFEQLISQVVNGTWMPGDRIPPERELCQQLGIARTSLREALKAMELVGMLDSRVGDGTFVCPRSEFLSRPLLWAFTGTDHTELQEIMEARVLIEENLAALAAQRGTDEQIASIKTALDSLKMSVSRHEPILDTDMAFHMAIAHASQNNVLANSVRLLRNLMRQWLYYKVLLPEAGGRVLKHHQTIYRAIHNRKPVAARRAMRAHLEEAMAMVQTAMKERAIEKIRSARATPSKQIAAGRR